MKTQTNVLKTGLLSLFLISVAMVNAQQEGHYINLTNNPFAVNPAAGGVSDVLQLELTSRTQWLGYNGGPRSMLLTGHSPIKIGKSGSGRGEYNVDDALLFASPKRSIGSLKHVVGGRALYDAIGPFLKTSVHGDYSIHLPFSKKLNMAAGIGLGWTNFGVREDRVVLYQADDAAYSEFLGNTSAQNILDVNAGLTFYGKNLFVGISTTQLLNNKTQFAGIATESNFNRHYFLIAKYQIKVSEEISVEPTMVGKIVQNSPLAGDFGARLIYKQSAWFALQYRTSNALTFQIGSNIIKNIYFSYGYELGIGALRTANNGTHEIQLGFYLGNNRNMNKEMKDANKAE